MNSQAAVKELTCDGCGRGASSEHIARRLRRLELATRYRPIHVQAVFLGAQSPADDKNFLYSAETGFSGEAAALLRALGIQTEARDVEAVLAEFQKRGFVLTHVLECPAEPGRDTPNLADDLLRKLPSVARRLRGSLRPKRVILVSRELAPVLDGLKSAQLGGELVLNDGLPFDLADSASVSQLTSAVRSL
ncbi:MAG TPA: hypothetical protein VN454_05040 [Candidatus Angelobacter sp.]|nr:hypothetical protein [Candidatus Angelobacter sp.]